MIYSSGSPCVFRFQQFEACYNRAFAYVESLNSDNGAEIFMEVSNNCVYMYVCMYVWRSVSEFFVVKVEMLMYVCATIANSKLL